MLIIIQFLCTPLFAQKTDSLQSLLQISKVNSRVDILNLLAEEFLVNSRDRSVKYAQEACNLSVVLGYKRGEMLANRNLGRASGLNAEFAKSVKHLSVSTKLAAQLGDSLVIAANAISTAYVYAMLNQHDKVLEYDQVAYSIYLKLQDKRGISNALNGIGTVYAQQGKLDSSLVLFHKALEVYKDLKLNNKVAMTLLNIGAAYADKNESVKAMDYYCASLSAFEQIKRDGRGVASVLQNISQLYLSRKEFGHAESAIRKAYSIRKVTKDDVDLATCLSIIGKLFQGKGQLDSATYYLNASLEISKRLKLYKMSYEAYESLAQIAEACKNYPGAYRNLRMARIFFDSASVNDGISRLHNLEMFYAIEQEKIKQDKLEQKKARQDAELQKQRWRQYFLIALVLGLLLVLIIVIRQYIQKKSWVEILEKKNELIGKQKDQIENINRLLELRTVRSKLDPHLIFNVLNGVRGLIRSNDPQGAADYLEKTCKFIRTALQYSTLDWISLEEEIQFTQKYLQIEQQRFGGKFECGIQFDAKLNSVKVPFMLIQPYVENAIIHGISKRKSEAGGVITIKAIKEEQDLHIIIEDNGVGRSKILRTDQGIFSLGSMLAEDRIKKLSRVSGNKMKVEIEDLLDSNGEATGTRVNILIVLKNDDSEIDYRLAM